MAVVASLYTRRPLALFQNSTGIIASLDSKNRLTGESSSTDVIQGFRSHTNIFQVLRPHIFFEGLAFTFRTVQYFDGTTQRLFPNSEYSRIS